MSAEKHNERIHKDGKLDEAGRQSFPASDPPNVGRPTGTEEPARPKDRQAPLPSKEEIEAARRGEGHKQR